MARQTAADDFDFWDYRESLLDAGVEWVRMELDRYDHESDAVTDAAFEIADEEVGYSPVSHSLAILEHSPNEPEEWHHMAEGKDDWREVIRTMAFTVVRQDFYDALENEGYLDDHWNPTDKLTGAQEA